jgi:hypothetical protein
MGELTLACCAAQPLQQVIDGQRRRSPVGHTVNDIDSIFLLQYASWEHTLR